MANETNGLASFLSFFPYHKVWLCLATLPFFFSLHVCNLISLRNYNAILLLRDTGSKPNYSTFILMAKQLHTNAYIKSCVYNEEYFIDSFFL